jgi:hypothetical protein
MEVQINSINSFLSFKLKPEVQELDKTIHDKLVSIFGTIDKNKKNKKFVKKPNINILKNHKLQNQKNNLVNRVNLILNKLSESNIDSLVIEFLENINQVDLLNFEEIQKAFYLKIMSEIDFIKIYLQFLKVLGFIYWKVQSYDLSFFLSIVEAKFKLDYTDLDFNPDNKFYFIKELDGDKETKRINNLMIIKNLIDQKFTHETLYNESDKIIINQTVFLPDIYHWFNSKNRELKDDERGKIHNILKNSTINISSREKVLLESLINKNNKPKQSIVQTIKNSQTGQTGQTGQTCISIKPIKQSEMSVKINIDTLRLECENIIEEYILNRTISDVKKFIQTSCTDALSKNKFSECLIDKYFLSNNSNSKLLIELVIELVNELSETQKLYKSNLSRGLILINNNWEDKSIEYNDPKPRMRTFLSTLKNLGITNGIEFLMTQYKITSNSAKQLN